MKTSAFMMLVLGLSTTGCAADLDGLTSSGQKEVIYDTYERDFRWSEPVACEVYLHARITDDELHTVEYDARVGQRELAIVYAIQEGDDFPLRVDVMEADGTPLVTVRAASHDLDVAGADGNMAFAVRGYDDEGFELEPGSGGALPPEALQLLACALPLRAELGAVPAFLLNRATGGRLPDNPDVSASSADDPPLVEDWDGKLTILGAFTIAGACLHADAWDCPCFTLDDTLAGPLHGQCAAVATPYDSSID